MHDINLNQTRRSLAEAYVYWLWCQHPVSAPHPVWSSYFLYAVRAVVFHDTFGGVAERSTPEERFASSIPAQQKYLDDLQVVVLEEVQV